MALTVHHLNCGTLCPRRPAWLGAATPLVCHCLLIETAAGLVLVDTGLGRAEIQRRALSPLIDALSPPRYHLAETAHAQIQALGYTPEDVRHIILTHLDRDHAGGLSDFPRARVHLHAHEYSGGVSQPNLLERMRYAARQWQHQPQWVTYTPTGERWFGLEAVRALEGLPEEILLIPLRGHTRGHSGVAVHSAEGWLLHAGDAFFDQRQIVGGRYPADLLLFQILEPWSLRHWHHSLHNLRTLAEHQPELRLFCSHDPTTLPSGKEYL
jgi:glyoxylase-like metal-dependent hydrolase (beta-lactamase superfamily II)